MNDDQLEAFAIRAARGDDVKKWPRGFSKDQRDYWRQFILDLERGIATIHFENGYKKAQEELAEQRRLMTKLAQRQLFGR